MNHHSRGGRIGRLRAYLKRPYNGDKRRGPRARVCICIYVRTPPVTIETSMPSYNVIPALLPPHQRSISADTSMPTAHYQTPSALQYHRRNPPIQLTRTRPTHPAFPPVSSTSCTGAAVKALTLANSVTLRMPLRFRAAEGSVCVTQPCTGKR